MVALAFILSFIFLAYLVIPGSIFRHVAGWGVPIRQFRGNRVEEIGFAVIVCTAPFILTSCLTWRVRGFKDHPFSVAQLEKTQSRGQAYTVFLEGTLRTNLAENTPNYWVATTQVKMRQARFLWWYWFFVALEAGWYAYVIRKRCFRNYPWIHTQLFKGLSAMHILHPQLHAETGTKEDKNAHLIVLLDIRTGRNDLVKGKLLDFGTEGELSGLLLEDPIRTRRTEMRKGTAVWRYIPSRFLYVPFASIVDMNIRYITEREFKGLEVFNVAIGEHIEEILLRHDISDVSVTVLSGGSSN
jgi:hypothetical protein